MNHFIRKLTNIDLKIFDDFLKPYTVTSMFLRSNAQRAGLEFEEGKKYCAHYYGLFIKNNLVGIIALNWNGNLFLQVPDLDLLITLIKEVAEENPLFPLKGILAPHNQALKILERLNPSSDNISLSSLEHCYSLDLNKLNIPLPLQEGIWKCRLAQKQDIPELIEWRRAYEIEALGADPKDSLSFPEIEKDLTLNEIFILEENDIRVSQANYNATTEDVYQIGGVWTPVLLRQRGYARGVVAGALLAAKRQGIQTGVLFARNPFAIRAYSSLGFEPVDQYHITLFKKPLALKQLKSV